MVQGVAGVAGVVQWRKIEYFRSNNNLILLSLAAGLQPNKNRLSVCGARMGLLHIDLAPFC